MINIYIKELEKEEFLSFYKFPKWTRNIIWEIIKKSNLMLKKEIDENKKIFYIPNMEKESIYKKVNKKIEKEKTKTQKVQIVLSNKMKKYKEYFKQYKIVDGKKILIKGIDKILEKVLEENAIEMQDVFF